MVLSCTVSEILQVFAPHPVFHRNFVSIPVDHILDVGVSPSIYLKLISREIIFEIFEM